MPQINKRELGSYYEQKTAEALEQKNVIILEKNYRCKFGEIDLIGIDHGYLVFFEVKYRSTQHNGVAAEAVDLKKQYKICRVADSYLLRHPDQGMKGIRFDVIAIDNGKARWIKNAFYYQEKR